jgi:hypothetical protein
LDDLKVQPSPTVPVDLLEGYRETEIGALPEEWEVVPLGNVTTKVFGGGTPSTKKVEFWDGPIPWTTTAIIGEEDTYLVDFQRGITEEGLLNSSTQIAPENSVLLGTRVGVGKAVVTPFEVAVNQDLTVLVPSPAALPEFLAMFMKEPSMQRWFSENKRGRLSRRCHGPTSSVCIYRYLPFLNSRPSPMSSAPSKTPKRLPSRS